MPPEETKIIGIATIQFGSSFKAHVDYQTLEEDPIARERDEIPAFLPLYRAAAFSFGGE